MARCLFKNLYANYARNARTRGLEFSLTRGHFDELIVSDCYICGNPPLNERRQRGVLLRYNGVDRVDNAKGYLPDNVRPCCRICNGVKGRLELTDLKEHLARMIKGLEDVG